MRLHFLVTAPLLVFHSKIMHSRVSVLQAFIPFTSSPHLIYGIFHFDLLNQGKAAKSWPDASTFSASYFLPEKRRRLCISHEYQFVIIGFTKEKLVQVYMSSSRRPLQEAQAEAESNPAPQFDFAIAWAGIMLNRHLFHSRFKDSHAITAACKLCGPFQVTTMRLNRMTCSASPPLVFQTASSYWLA